MSDRYQGIETEEGTSKEPVVTPGRTELKTKPVPIIIVLIAAGVSCVMSVVQGTDFSTFFKRLLVTVVIFALIATILKIYLDKIFNKNIKNTDTSEDEAAALETEGGESTDEASQPSMEEDSEILMDEQETDES